MIFYRLALQRVIEYLELNKPSPEELRLMKLLNKKPKEKYKTKLKTDKTLNFYISILLSIVSILTCLSIPFSAVESPSEIFKQRGMHKTYIIIKIIEKYTELLDIVIIALMITLIHVSTRMILDAIKNTKIDISPWVEMGKYSLPDKIQSQSNNTPGIRRSYYL